MLESHITVLRWLKGYLAEGVEGLKDIPRSGRDVIVTDEFNVSGVPTLRAMWSPNGQQVMIPTPG